MTLQPIYIAGLNAGLETDKKPFLLPNQAFQILNNAYCFRERILKREGITLIGRLQRIYASTSLGNSGASPWTFNLFSTVSPAITETNAEIASAGLIGSVPLSITIGANTITDLGNGTFSTSGGITGYLNYITGSVTITGTGGGGVPTTATFGYYPSLPVMGISQRTIPGVNLDQTIFFDTKYAYIFVGTNFQEFIPGSTWNAQDFSFFWCTNYRGVTPDIRLFFVTNFQNDAGNPMRYTDGATWTTFAPGIAGATPTGADTFFMFSAEILIPYYGRLIALNTWEGTTQGGSVNIFNRARFSQVGNPTQQTVVGPPFVGGAWRSDVFGKGGFVDAPTNEEIISAVFYKNTLIVGFENSTWQLRYVGEYGLPFIWERISSDFGMESTFASVLFDDGVIAVGDRAITKATSNGVNRVDLQVPDTVFNISNINNGPQRVQSIRDFQKELIYWSIPSDSRSSAYKYPDGILLYNYRNQTYAQFRENVTAFGTFESSNLGVTWDSLTVTWDSNVTWDDGTDQPSFPNIALGNQEGFIHIINYGILPDPSLSVTGVTIGNSPSSVTLKIVNHNLVIDEFIYLTNLQFTTALNVPTPTNLNNAIFSVNRVIDPNTILVEQWNGFTYVTNFNVTPDSTAIYVGGGQATLLWQLLAQTKDFNPFQEKGKKLFLSYIDFQTDATPTAVFTVEVYLNSSNAVQGNLLVGNQEIETFTFTQLAIQGATQSNPCVIESDGHNLQTGTQIYITGVGGMTQLNNNTFVVTVVDADHLILNGINSTSFAAYTAGGNWIVASGRYYVPGSQYAWHRFFATATAQYVSLALTFDDNLANNIATYNQTWVLNAMALYMREAGKINI
jgi:hypothetical protein